MPYKDREKRLEHNKKYYQINKEKIKEKIKEYREKNKEKIKKYNKTHNRLKSNRIAKWKSNGLKINDNDLDKLYERYINSNECELCGVTYTDTNKRCLDHDHHTGLFRNVVCHKCNSSSKLLAKKNKNIHETKYGTFRCRIRVNGIHYYKTFKTKSEAINFRDFLM